MALKKQFNVIKYAHPDWQDQDGQPWVRSIHRDAHAQPFTHLARAFARYFSAIKARAPAHPPRFKRKGRCRDSFYVANDKFRIEGKAAVLPKVGRVGLAEALRFTGKIMGAAVSREADWWFLAVQVEVPGHLARRGRSGDGVVGVDLGITAAATLSTGEKVQAPRPLKRALRRLRIRGRRLSRKLEAAKRAAGISGPLSVKNGTLGLGERAWTCAGCGACHDRDINAGINLKRLATGALAARSALPVASQAATPGTAAEDVSAAGGKVTPARHEPGQQDGSGQEENAAHLCARF